MRSRGALAGSLLLADHPSPAGGSPPVHRRRGVGPADRAPLIGGCAVCAVSCAVPGRTDQASWRLVQDHIERFGTLRWVDDVRDLLAKLQQLCAAAADDLGHVHGTLAALKSPGPAGG